MSISTACNRQPKSSELGLDELLDGHVLLVEWPERLSRTSPRTALPVTFQAVAKPVTSQLEAAGNWKDLLTRNSIINGFIENSSASRRHAVVSRGRCFIAAL